jgi:hypothetical protein
MGMSQFVINEQVRFQYAGIYAMYVMSRESYRFTHPLTLDDRLMEPILKWLEEQDYISLKGHAYGLTQKGSDVLHLFLDRYHLFLRDYDVFCGVDLKNHSFAFSQYKDCKTDRDWSALLAQERWEDIRLAVAEYKGLDPVEMVFMSLIHEGRFGRNEEGAWDEDLLLGEIWDEIESICNSAPRMASLNLSETSIQTLLSKGQGVLMTLKE